jgi:hypothetical protein
MAEETEVSLHNQWNSSETKNSYNNLPHNASRRETIKLPLVNLSSSSLIFTKKKSLQESSSNIQRNK